jgi:hypothetical protein
MFNLKSKSMKTASKILVTVAIVTFATANLAAQETSTAASKPSGVETSKTTSTPAAVPGKFIDANKNGVCDNAESRSQAGRGVRYADKNGDGVCDNRGTVSRGQGRGQGCGQGHQHRNRHGECCGRGQGRGNRNSSQQ